MRGKVKRIDPSALSLIVYEIELANEMLLNLYENIKTHEVFGLNIADTQNLTIESVIESFSRELNELNKFIGNISLLNLNLSLSFYYGFLTSDQLTDSLIWAIDELNKNISSLSSTSILNIYSSIVGACGAFREKVIYEELQIYLLELMHEGARIGGVKIYGPEKDSDEIFQATMKSAMKAEKLFFSLTNNPDFGALTLSNKIKERLFISRKKAPIDIQENSGRQTISAYKYAIEQSMEGIDISEIEDTKDLYHRIGWHQYGNKSPSGSHLTFFKGSTPYVRKQDEPLEINLQFKPTLNQIGNAYIKGVGSYGKVKIKDILFIIETFTNQEPEKEKALALLLIRYKQGDGEAFSIESLESAGFVLPTLSKERQSILQKIQRAAFLICYFEEARRNNGEPHLPEYPFGAAISCALLLIKQGHLRMIDVFDEDSEFGVFTGKSVMGENRNKTLTKFKNLFDFFLEVNKEDNIAYYVDELSNCPDVSDMQWSPSTNYFYGLFSHMNEKNKPFIIHYSEPSSDEDDLITIDFF